MAAHLAEIRVGVYISDWVILPIYANIWSQNSDRPDGNVSIELLL